MEDEDEDVDKFLESRRQERHKLLLKHSKPLHTDLSHTESSEQSLQSVQSLQNIESIENIESIQNIESIESIESVEENMVEKPVEEKVREKRCLNPFSLLISHLNPNTSDKQDPGTPDPDITDSGTPVRQSEEPDVSLDSAKELEDISPISVTLSPRDYTPRDMTPRNSTPRNSTPRDETLRDDTVNEMTDMTNDMTYVYSDLQKKLMLEKQKLRNFIINMKRSEQVTPQPLLTLPTLLLTTY